MGPGAEPAFVPKRGDWAAEWIWLDDRAWPDRQKCRRTSWCEEESPCCLALLRREFELPLAPRRATAWISADTRYVCAINGERASCGPAEAGGDFRNTESPDWWFYDGLDLTDRLRPGRNAIAAEVMLGPVALVDLSMGRGGFLFEMLIELSDGREIVISSGPGWRGLPCEAARSAVEYDARLEPPGWKLPGFDDSDWPPVSVLGAAEGSLWNLLPREVPPLMEYRVPAGAAEAVPASLEDRFGNLAGLTAPGTMVNVAPGEPVTFRLSFERELAGYLSLDVEGPAGTRLEVAFQEMAGAGDPTEVETLFLPGRRWQHVTRRLRGFQFLEIAVRFPEGAAEPLRVHTLEAVFTSFPLRYPGRFECSDELFNRLWDVGRWTDQLCMQSYHLDSPIHQEPPADTGDYLVEALVSYCCFGETRLARADILRIARLLRLKRGRMFTTSYSLMWIWMLHDYWMHSADTATVRDVLARVHDLLELFESYRGPEGLVSQAPNYMFLDWVPAGEFNLHHPPASMGMGYMSAVLHRSLLHAAELSATCGRESAAKLYRQRAAGLHEAFVARLWDPERGLFRDGLVGISSAELHKWLPPDPGEPTFTAHTNVLAVISGLSGRNRGREVMERIIADDSLPIMQPYFLHYFFEALEFTGLFERHALERMRTWRRLLEEHPGSLKEKWDSGDYSHAWSATPTYQLSARVLGVTPAAPGYEEIHVRPRLGDLDRASGTVPTPYGPVSLCWEREGALLRGRLRGPAGRRLRLEVGGASGIEARTAAGPVRAREGDGQALSWTLAETDYEIRAVLQAPGPPGGR